MMRKNIAIITGGKDDAARRARKSLELKMLKLKSGQPFFDRFRMFWELPEHLWEGIAPMSSSRVFLKMLLKVR